MLDLKRVNESRPFVKHTSGHELRYGNREKTEKKKKGKRLASSKQKKKHLQRMIKESKEKM